MLGGARGRWVRGRGGGSQRLGAGAPDPGRVDRGHRGAQHRGPAPAALREGRREDARVAA